MRLAILGLGLIGGSIARALAVREPGAWHVTAWSRTLDGPRRAVEEGVVADAVSDATAAIAGADLVVLAASPAANLALVERLGPALAAAGGLLTDVTSVQAPIAARAAAVPGLRFVGGHPMSGRERRGYAAADAALFVDRPWVVLPGPRASGGDVDLVRRLARACGAHPLELEPGVHDRAVAAISHVPLLAAVALVEAAVSAPDWPVARSLAAQGWRDATRLARGDAELGAGILAMNASAIAEALRRYRHELERWQVRLDALVAAGDPAAAVPGLAADLARTAAHIEPAT